MMVVNIVFPGLGFMHTSAPWAGADAWEGLQKRRGGRRNYVCGDWGLTVHFPTMHPLALRIAELLCAPAPLAQKIGKHFWLVYAWGVMLGVTWCGKLISTPAILSNSCSRRLGQAPCETWLSTGVNSGYDTLTRL